jgi:hypothetical protein
VVRAISLAHYFVWMPKQPGFSLLAPQNSVKAEHGLLKEK